MNEFLVSPVGLVGVAVAVLFVLFVLTRFARGSGRAQEPTDGEPLAPEEASGLQEDVSASPVDAHGGGDLERT